MSTFSNQDSILESPRERHYTLGHEAFRQLCEYDPHQFFERMVSGDSKDFISELIKQVELACPSDPTILDPDCISVTISRVGDKPFIVIKMPPAKAYVECVYVGVVGILDIHNPGATPHPEIRYYTLEVGEGEQDDCLFFCQWVGDTHYNLAELDNVVSMSDFAMLVSKRIEDEKL